jgi:5-formyltetrahydrofolate cyclo-ligase
MMPPSKSSIRKHVLAKRNAASPEWRAMASRDIARHALPLAASGPGGAVAGYWPYKSEADPRPLMELLRGYGRPLALPVIRHPHVIFRRWIEGVELVDAGFGTLGPDASADEVTPAVLLVPLAAFDAAGNRIGWGQGHYDRVIARLDNFGDSALNSVEGGALPSSTELSALSPKLKLLTIGVAFAFQQVDAVPAEAHDRPLDAVATELGVSFFSP